MFCVCFFWRSSQTNQQVNLEKSDDGGSPLSVAAYHDKEAVGLVLLEHGANPNHSRPSDGAGPLYFSTQTRKPEQMLGLLKALLRCGALVDQPLKDRKPWEQGFPRGHRTPLISAVAYGNEKYVQLLLEHNADPNGRTSVAEGNRAGEGTVHARPHF